MITEHDADLILRCRRLGHEVTFGFCRKENRGLPCRLILDCWWERFDVRAFLGSHLSPAALAQLENPAPPAPKLLTLVDLIEQARERIASNASSPPRSLRDDAGTPQSTDFTDAGS